MSVDAVVVSGCGDGTNHCDHSDHASVGASVLINARFQLPYPKMAATSMVNGGLHTKSSYEVNLMNTHVKIT